MENQATEIPPEAFPLTPSKSFSLSRIRSLGRNRSQPKPDSTGSPTSVAGVLFHSNKNTKKDTTGSSSVDNDEKTLSLSDADEYKREIVEVIDASNDDDDIFPLSEQATKYLTQVKSCKIEVERILSSGKNGDMLETDDGVLIYKTNDKNDHTKYEKDIPGPPKLSSTTRQRSVPMFQKAEKIDPIKTGFLATGLERGDIYSVGRQVSRLTIPSAPPKQDSMNDDTSENNQSKNIGKNSNNKTTDNQFKRSRSKSKKEKIYGAQNVELVYSPNGLQNS